MGLATSQVRLLALTSRKADVEMQIQLNSKRKTMLTREATELSKLYYAKLQNSKIMYSTTNGNKEVTYDYLMSYDSSTFFDDIVDCEHKSGYDRKTSDSMILTDSYGRVILSDAMAEIVIDTYNENGAPGNNVGETVESKTIHAMKILLETFAGGKDARFGVSNKAKEISKMFNYLYNGFIPDEGDTTNYSYVSNGNSEDKQLGYQVLQALFRNGYQEGGTVYKCSDGSYCSDYKNQATTHVELTNGTFYKIKDANTLDFIPKDDGAGGVFYYNGQPINTLTAYKGKQLCQAFSYYGSIFSAAFSGTRTFGEGTDAFTKAYCNISANITMNDDGQYVLKNNDTYARLKLNNDSLQDGLKSGLYQLVNVDNRITGGYAKAQGLNYFKTQNYVVEQTDNGERETITAWYNAARADLNTKESYWDSEITALSSELNSITTEIDSVKKLREDAISSTFKWGNA